MIAVSCTRFFKPWLMQSTHVLGSLHYLIQLKQTGISSRFLMIRRYNIERLLILAMITDYECNFDERSWSDNFFWPKMDSSCQLYQKKLLLMLAFYWVVWLALILNASCRLWTLHNLGYVRSHLLWITWPFREFPLLIKTEESEKRSDPHNWLKNTVMTMVSGYFVIQLIGINHN